MTMTWQAYVLPEGFDAGFFCKYIRTTEKLTQPVLAKRLGISGGTLSRVENRKKPASLELKVALGSVFRNELKDPEFVHGYQRFVATST